MSGSRQTPTHPRTAAFCNEFYSISKKRLIALIGIFETERVIFSTNYHNWPATSLSKREIFTDQTRDGRSVVENTARPTHVFHFTHEWFTCPRQSSLFVRRPFRTCIHHRFPRDFRCSDVKKKNKNFSPSCILLVDNTVAVRSPRVPPFLGPTPTISLQYFLQTTELR